MWTKSFRLQNDNQTSLQIIAHCDNSQGINGVLIRDEQEIIKVLTLIISWGQTIMFFFGGGAVLWVMKFFSLL